MKARVLCGAAAMALVFGGIGANAQTEEPNVDERAQVEAEVGDISEAFEVQDGDEARRHHRRHHRHHRARAICSKVNATDEQKEQLREALVEYAKQKIVLRAELKLAKLEYAAEVLKPDGVRATAATAGVQIAAAAGKLAGAKVSFSTKVLFDIMTKEQRKPAYLCLKALERRHHHRGHGRGHGHHRS